MIIREKAYGDRPISEWIEQRMIAIYKEKYGGENIIIIKEPKEDSRKIG